MAMQDLGAWLALRGTGDRAIRYVHVAGVENDNEFTWPPTAPVLPEPAREARAVDSDGLVFAPAILPWGAALGMSAAFWRFTGGMALAQATCWSALAST